MNGLLDCSTYQSALESLAGLLDINAVDLEKTLASFAVDWDGEESEEMQLVHGLGVQSRHALPQPQATRWFHATRAPRDRQFADGLLPTYAALPRLLEDVEAIARQWVGPAEWTTYRESWATSGRFYARQFSSKAASPNWEGPFAFLVRDAALGRHQGHKQFTRICEALEDICADFQEVFGHPLRSAYEASTEPCLVVFTAPGGSHGGVAAAIVFAHRTIHGLSHGRSSNTNYSGKGKVVPTSWFDRIEWL